MQRILFGVCACVLGLGLTGAAQAREPHHHPGPAPIVRGGSPYYAQHGVRFNGGYYYPGRDHHHWERRVWDAGNRRYNYYDPSLRCYYYWSPVKRCYYPVGSVCD